MPRPEVTHLKVYLLPHTVPKTLGISKSITEYSSGDAMRVGVSCVINVHPGRTPTPTSATSLWRCADQCA